MSDTSPFGFGKFVPGFDFLQNLAKNASEGSGKMPGLSHWIAPTMSVEDLEKRVEELKAVQFWLEQNSRALTATIQALEVQKMTLSTLKSMNVSMGDMTSLFQPKSGSEDKASAASPANPADAFAGVTQAMTDAMVRATSAFAPLPTAPSAAPDKAPAPAAAAPAPQEQPAASGPQGKDGKGEARADTVLGSVIDPMQWWGSLTQQFQQIAASVLQDVAKQASLESATNLTQDAVKSATELGSQMAAAGMKNVKDVQSAVGRTAPAKKAVSTKTKSTARTSGKAAAAPAASAAKKAPARSAVPAPPKRTRG